MGRDALALADCRGAFDAIDRPMIDLFVAAGTPDDCLRSIVKYVDAGVDLPILMPFGRDLRSIVELAQSYRGH